MLVGELCKEICSRDVDGSIVGGGGGAMGEGTGDHAAVDCSGASKWIRNRSSISVHWRLGIAQGRFEREGVGCEPIE